MALESVTVNLYIHGFRNFEFESITFNGKYNMVEIFFARIFIFFTGVRICWSSFELSHQDISQVELKTNN